MKISYNWLKWYAPEIPEADRLSDTFTFHLCEVEGVEKLPDGDTIFDINILPNRAHDLLSHQGIARELAGQLGKSYKDPSPMYKVPEAKPTKLAIKIETDKCRRYMGRVVHNMKIGPSPDWVVKHLESIGQRSINNIVDATNLTMFDCGQPTHAFDASKITNYELRITNAEEGEELELLGSEKMKVTLHNSDMVIASGGKTLAIAGVKGATNSGINEGANDIILEVANFDPVSVRKTGQRLGILSDARKRFENDLSAELAPFAMRELSALILEMCPEATFEEIVDVYPNPQKEQKINFDTDFINKKLGATISSDIVEDILKRYAYTYSRAGGSFEVVVSSLRLDLRAPEDMVEEIGRIYGYDNVAAILPKIDFTPKVSGLYYQILAARKKLLDDGYSEVMTYSFRDAGVVEVLKSASDKKFLRTNITDGLKESFESNKRNAPLLGIDPKDMKIFEIGTVFPKKEIEEVHVAFAEKKGVTEMTLEEYIKNYELKITNYESYGDLLSTFNFQLSTRRFSTWSLYPFIARDIALWVPENIGSDAVIEIIKTHMGAFVVRGPELFDQFSKDGRTSYAFRLVFQSPHRTMTDAEVNEIMGNIGKALEKQGFSVR